MKRETKLFESAVLI